VIEPLAAEQSRQSWNIGPACGVGQRTVLDDLPKATDLMLGDHPADGSLNGTRDIHGMILGYMVDRAAESPGGNAAGQESHTLLKTVGPIMAAPLPE
jgi:hypothetical protein